MKDNDLKKILQEQQKETKKYIKEVVVGERKQTERYVDSVLKKQQETTETYIGGLNEDFDHKLDIVLEALQPLPEMNKRLTKLEETVSEEIVPKVDATYETVKEMGPKLDATFDKVGEIAVDVEIIKETVKDHGAEIQRLKTAHR